MRLVALGADARLCVRLLSRDHCFVVQPTGTVTLLFTDIEGSTSLLQRLGTREYTQALELHRRVLRDAFARHGGYEVDTQGDGFFVAFDDAEQAVAAAGDAQQALAGARWPEGCELRVRMGIHTGAPSVAPPSYVGLDVHRAARVMAAGHGGQVLMTEATRERLPVELSVQDLGVHQLKDLLQPEPLYQCVLPGLRSEFPALKTLGNRPTNLPVVATPFIGRAAELNELGELLGREEVRLVTLTGPGGIGKTRLALQAVAELVDDFRDGVFWVPFASVSDPAEVAASLAQALRLREEAGRPIGQTVADYLRGKQLLLLLDNLEHVVAAARELIALVLGAAPSVRVVSTSRVSLRISGEHLYDVPPLAVPPTAEPATETGEVDAVELFVSRAQAVERSFALTAENAPVVAELVRRLEGLPLAVELAAARVRVLPPGELLRRLEDRLRLLTAGAHDADPRQRTLRATIEWSHDLLAPEEQRLLARMSVFAGGCRLEAAEAVCGWGGDPPVEVVEGISSLVEQSLVRRREDFDGRSRYWMLETIREFASERLRKSGELEDLQRRHTEHFVALAERAQRAMRGEEISLEEAPQVQLQHELVNLRAALRWAIETAPEIALRLAAPAFLAWMYTGRFSEAQALLEETLEQAPLEPSVERGRALGALTVVQQALGKLDEAEATGRQALEVFRAGTDQTEIARTLAVVANCAAAGGRVRAAKRDIADARTIAVQVGSETLYAEVMDNAAHVEGFAGDLASAQAALEEVITIYRRRGVPRDIWIWELINVGWFALNEGDLERARAANEEYLAFESVKNPIGIANAQNNLGLVALFEGKRDEAAALYSQSLPPARDAEAAITVAEGLYGLSAVAAIDRDLDRSVRLRAAAESLADETVMEAPIQRLKERYLDPATKGLDATTRRVAEQEGAAMTLAEAVSYALELS
jgi:predicted ATPase/class 3 adenylate cyclase